ncbi:FHA domain-containing protein FhaB [Zhongshania aliphaticivorans]|uniref:FHA domain-containing protein FhaB n=1 Tax=Zhongshania aliphaticivorans TaxID=1470434 RepID=A0A5S9NFF0_9GAMM|nr:FHA domain-containing protein [Zhongshania aliphaticivorans]CAA0088209.1 FHA domain-containing protein FhaB [Zhongshania aliphaticivorans]CAA0116151.1 FHA domain-containing protein FhaB [Zhongshania aliphaticivorans]CAA0120377.1 FHA domain-containing protein FhaB [Zhongshania aliphaticivorans]
MDLELVSVDGGDKYAITASSVLIGRDASNDITIAKDLLSRCHAKLSLAEDEWLLEDLDSTNGTSVNNRQITRPTKVKAGDVIKFGEMAYYLKNASGDERTIVASRLPQKELTGGSVVVDEESDGDVTSFQQSYQLPSGWTNVEKSPAYTQESIDKLIKRTITSKQLNPDVVLVFYINQARPLVYGISAKKAESFWSIGRGQDVKVKVDDPSISTQHARLIYKAGVWSLEDVGSTNGLRVDEEACAKVVLKDQSVVTLGRVDMVFRKLQ